MDIFERIYNMELNRDDEYLYTLGDDNLDQLWNLRSKSPVFTPSKQQIDDFAAFTYLFGLCGFVPYNFTAIPVGYIATFKNGDEAKTIIIDNGPVARFYREKLHELVKEKLEDESLSEEERTLFSELDRMLGNEEMSLLDVCLYINSIRGDALDERINDSMFEFSNHPDSLNSRNCDDNHKVLENICCDLLGYDYKSATEEQRKEAKALSKVILDTWILPGYFTYVGHNRTGDAVYNDVDVLTNLAKLESLRKDLKSNENIAKVLNMCSTDYTADVVYDILKVISKCEDIKQSKEKIDSLVQDSDYAKERKENARNYLRNKR